MSDYLQGLLTIPGVPLGLAVLGAVAWGASLLLVRVWPTHWAVDGPMRKSADVQRLFRNVNARGRHVGSFRRLLSLGPWTIYAARYRPGNVEEAD